MMPETITFQSVLENFDNNLWYFHFLVEEANAQKLIDGDNRRVLCAINGDEYFPCALMPSELGWFINVNKERRKKLGLQEGQTIEVQLQKDTSEFGMPMPPEMEMVLEQDEAGKTYFEALTMGKKRSLIYLVLKVKNTDSRIRKALAIMAHLKEVKGQLDFKMLNDTIKYFNQQAKLK